MFTPVFTDLCFLKTCRIGFQINILAETATNTFDPAPTLSLILINYHQTRFIVLLTSNAPFEKLINYRCLYMLA